MGLGGEFFVFVVVFVWCWVVLCFDVLFDCCFEVVVGLGFVWCCVVVGGDVLCWVYLGFWFYYV